MSFLVGFVNVLSEGKSPLKRCLHFDGLYRQETIGQHFPMNCSKIGHPYAELTYLFGRTGMGTKFISQKFENLSKLQNFKAQPYE